MIFIRKSRLFSREYALFLLEQHYTLVTVRIVVHHAQYSQPKHVWEDTSYGRMSLVTRRMSHVDKTVQNHLSVVYTNVIKFVIR